MRNTESTPRNTWATFARAAREDIGMTAADLYRELGVDRTTVWRWETGKARPEDPAIVLRFAEVTGVDPEEALVAAGLRPGVARTVPTRDPLDPDVLALLHKLADHRTNDATREYIKMTLRVLASLSEVPERERTG